jgi:hypothetical protein
MARKIIDIGQRGNDGTGDSIREAFRKINDNFLELYSASGLGESLRFTSLLDTPSTLQGFDNHVVSVDTGGQAITFKELVGGAGVTFDFTDPNKITINAAFSSIQGDEAPQLGGPLNAFSGGIRYPFGNLLDLNSTPEVLDGIARLTSAYSASVEAANPERLAVNKSYADSKLSRAGTDAVDTATGVNDPLQGVMSGPLILSRDPVADDDLGPFAGRIAATKRYVDNASYFSRINLYVSTTGDDAREDIAEDQKGRALAYAFRSIEAAAKRAEELMLEAPLELGPYRKLLTFTPEAQSTQFCTLTAIETSPLSGSGAVAFPVMTLDTITISSIGSNYLPNDLIVINGGEFSAQIVLRVNTSQPGSGEIVQFEIVSSGLYTALPPITNAATTTNSTAGSGATFNLTFKLDSITVDPDNRGTGYSFVSVRILGGGGSGAFAEADVVNGSIASVSVTADGQGFTSLPEIRIELPRMKIFTGGIGTDFTKTPGPSRDIREGLFLQGEMSGALANILAHDGELDNDGNELFDIDIVFGAFELGERISYGDPIQQLNITILVETGTYEENFPIKVPANVSISGDEFRRTLIRPRPGMSTSPWAAIHFCRDTVVDGLAVATQRFGTHYLLDSTQDIYPAIDNPGRYRSAARLLKLNRTFLKTEVVGWINAQIANNIAPFTENFVYNQALCERDVGLLIDAMAFDLRYGGQRRTVSAALKYYEGVTQLGNSLIAITEQKAETIAAINYLNFIAQAVLDNTPPAAIFGIEPQVIDPAIVPEENSDTLFAQLVGIVVAIIDDPTSYNKPKNNDEMDVFLMNDATRLYQMTIQGAGGFALVLDPEGQILTKSPYAQVGSVFGKSKNEQTFTGSLFIDGFAGNQQFVPVSKSENDYVLTVDGLVRRPQTPFTFFRAGEAYRVNYLRSYDYDPAGSTAEFILDELTPYTPKLFRADSYDQAKCSRDVGLIVDAVLRDLVFNTNYQSTKAGLAYRRAYSTVVLDDQLYETVEAINFVRDEILKDVEDLGSRTVVSSRFLVITNILQRGDGAAPRLVFPNTVNADGGVFNATSILQANRTFIQAEIVAWINDQIATQTAPFTSGFVYDSAKCSRDVGYIVDALSFDLLYGGNISIVDNALSYWYNGTVIENQTAETAAAYNRLKTIVASIVQNQLITASPGNSETQDNTTFGNGSLAAATTLGSLIDIIIDGVANENSIPAAVEPNFNASTNTIGVGIRNIVIPKRSAIQAATINQINTVIALFELVTPGNRSMLSNDFTCINDMGYGLLATNGGLTEAVSMFTYYCYAAYYSLNGGQIRSIGGSSANGVYALVAEGSDPLEIPDIVFLVDDISQGATVYAPDGLSPFQTSVSSLTIYATVDEYIPYNQSEIEVDHGSVLGIVRYFVASADVGGPVPSGVVKLNLSTTGAGNTQRSGLLAPVNDGDRVTIRSVFAFKFDDVGAIVQTRPSTALTLLESPERVYRVLGISGAGLPEGTALLTFRENYDFVDALVFKTTDPSTQPEDHGDTGDNQIAITNLSRLDAARATGAQFVWKGTKHNITGYENSEQTGEDYARLKFVPPLADPVTGYEGTVSLRIGAQKGMSGDITAQISTARFTGHDLLDIGTGSYADSNYPNVIFGIPANPKDPQKEVQERGKGRVFFVSTDQDGNFRVGDLFRVDQGTGTVTFAASIALSDLDGLGFKRGVSISEFSTDDTMTDNATDKVPVEQAVRAYIDRRLGQNHNGGVLTDFNIIPANTGGFMALDGSLTMRNNMNLGNNRIVGLADPQNALDAVNRQWHTVSNLQDGSFTSPTNSSLMTFTGVGTSVVNAAVTGDIGLTRTGNTLDAQITAGAIINADVNASAAIAQSKLAMNIAAAAAAAPTTNIQANSGLSSFDSADFQVTNGWVSIRPNGISLAQLPQIAGRNVLANAAVGTTPGNVSAVPYATVVDQGLALKKNQFGTGAASVGYLKHTTPGDFTLDSGYTVVGDSSGNIANTLVVRDANGDFAANTVNFNLLRIDSKNVIDTVASPGTDTGSIQLLSYRGQEAILLGDGALPADRKNVYKNDEHVFQTQGGVRGTINTGTITSGGASTTGTLIGNWQLGIGSKLDASVGTLESTTLTTGSVSTSGTITGAWSLATTSSLTLGSGGLINAVSGTLRSTTLTTGAQATAGVVTGAWTVASGSTFVATTVQNQANSATIIATSANTGNQIVLRDASGNFTANTITAALSGNASTASTWQTARTITLGGDLSGSVSINGSANVTLTATVVANAVALGTDTTGQYAQTVAVSGSGISINAANADDGTNYTITSSATSANTPSSIVFRDASGNFTANIITAALSGNATTATTATNSNNASLTATNTASQHFITFTAAATGNQPIRTDNDLTYNPGTNILTIGGGSGTVEANLTGTASQATTAINLNTASAYQVGSLGIGVAGPAESGRLRVNNSLSVGSAVTPSGINGEIRAQGNIIAFSSSDRRLKENIQPINDALNKLRQISGVMYDWTDEYIENNGGEDGYFVRKRDTGVIAQDVEAVLPEVVADRDDGYKAVRYEKLAGLIIQAINELADQVDDIKKRLN